MRPTLSTRALRRGAAVVLGLASFTSLAVLAGAGTGDAAARSPRPAAAAPLAPVGSQHARRNTLSRERAYEAARLRRWAAASSDSPLPAAVTTTTPPGRPVTPPIAQSVPTTLPRPAGGLVSGRVTVVGDSVTVDAQPSLEADIPGCVVDAEVGEQWETGVSVLQELRADGQLGAVVVVALGTNGPVSAPEFAQMMSVLSGTSRVVVVTNHVPDWWGEANNALFRSELSHYPTLRIADWDAAASAHPSWLYSDDTHMPIGGAGAQAFAELVKEQI